jgi:DNA-binding NarL/FixJ family response regulator
MLRVLIIDDSPLFLDSFCSLLERYPGVAVVATASNGDDGWRAAALLAPDLVFVDMNMPGLDGLGLATRLLRQHPGMRVVIVSLNDGAEYRTLAAASGVERFVGKSDLFRDLPSILADPPVLPDGHGARW